MKKIRISQSALVNCKYLGCKTAEGTYALFAREVALAKHGRYALLKRRFLLRQLTQSLSWLAGCPSGTLAGVTRLLVIAK